MSTGDELRASLERFVDALTPLPEFNRARQLLQSALLEMDNPASTQLSRTEAPSSAASAANDPQAPQRDGNEWTTYDE